MEYGSCSEDVAQRTAGRESARSVPVTVRRICTTAISGRAGGHAVGPRWLPVGTRAAAVRGGRPMRSPSNVGGVMSPRTPVRTLTRRRWPPDASRGRVSARSVATSVRTRIPRGGPPEAPRLPIGAVLRQGCATSEIDTRAAVRACAGNQRGRPALTRTSGRRGRDAYSPSTGGPGEPRPGLFALGCSPRHSHSSPWPYKLRCRWAGREARRTGVQSVWEHCPHDHERANDVRNVIVIAPAPRVHRRVSRRAPT